MKERKKTLIRCEQGSFTIESSLVFPIVFITIILFLFLSIVTYQKVTLYYLASITAEKTTMNWTNSHKDSRSGEFLVGEYDPLYWRDTEESWLDAMLGFSQKKRYTKLDFDATGRVLNLTQQKIKKAGEGLPSRMNGEVVYQKENGESQVQVSLEKPLKLPRLLGFVLGEKVRVTVASPVHDPVEVIRNLAFVSDYQQRVEELGKPKLDLIFIKQRKEFGLYE